MSEVFDKAVEEAMGSVKIPLGGRGIPSAMGSGTKEGLASLGERLYSEYEKLPWYKQLLLDVAPGTGETISAYEAAIFAEKTKEGYKKGDLLATAGHGALTGLSALGAIPVLGAGIRGVKAGVKGVGKGLSDIMSRPANINVPTEQTKFTASRIFDPKQPSERGDQIQIELLQNDKPPLLQSTANKLYDDGYQLKTRSSPALDENAMPIKGTFESDIWLGKDDKTDSIGLFSKFSEKDGEPFVEIFFREATGGASNPVSLKKYELRLAKERAAGHEAGSTAARRRGTTRKFFGDLNNPEDLDNLVDDAVRLNQKFIKENQEVSKIFQKYRNMNEAVAKKRIKKLTEELKEEQKKLNTRLDKELKGEKQDTWNVDRSRGLSGLGEPLLKSDEALEQYGKQWKHKNLLPKSQRQEQKPKVKKAAKEFEEGILTGKEFRAIIKAELPIKPINKMVDVPEFDEIIGALKSNQVKKGIVGVDAFEIADGTRLSTRLDIPAYNDYDKWIVSIHDAGPKGPSKAYSKSAKLTDVIFGGTEKLTGKDTKTALRIAKGADKSTFARMEGSWNNVADDDTISFAERLLKNKKNGKYIDEAGEEWIQVGMNPYRASYFYDKATGQALQAADEVIQVGPLVFARGARKPTLSEYKKGFTVQTEKGPKVFKHGGSIGE